MWPYSLLIVIVQSSVSPVCIPQIRWSLCRPPDLESEISNLVVLGCVCRTYVSFLHAVRYSVLLLHLQWIMEYSVGLQVFECSTHLQSVFMLWLEVFQLYVGYQVSLWLDYEHKHRDMIFALTEGILWEVSPEIQRSGCCREKTDGEPCVMSSRSYHTAN